MERKFDTELTLIELRKIRSMSQEYIAKQLNISAVGYSKKEKKRSEFTVSELIKLCEIFEKNTDEMIKIIKN